MSWFRRHTTDLIALALLLAVFAAFFGPVITGEKMFLTGGVVKSDLVNYNLPIRSFFAHWIKQGVFPMWTDGYALGFPILAEGEVGHFYLPNWPFYLLIPNATVAVQWTILSHFLLALGCTYLLARRQYRIGPAGSAIAALVFTFGAYLIVELGQVNILTEAAWFPLALLLLERLRERPRPRTAGALGVVWALQMFGGHIPTFAFGTALLLVYYTARTLLQRTGRVRTLLFVSGALVVSTVVAAPQLVPQWELTRITGHGIQQTERQAAAYQFPVSDLGWLVNPRLVGPHVAVQYLVYLEKDVLRNDVVFPWGNDAYVGISTLLLAVAGVALRDRRRALAAWFAGLALLALLFAMGGTTPVFHWVRTVLVPLRIFRYPQRALVIFQLAAGIAAGLGVESILRRLQRWPRVRWVVAGALVLLVAAELTYGNRPVVFLGNRSAWDSRPPVLNLLPPNDPAYRIDGPGTDRIDASTVTESSDHFALRNLLQPDYTMLFGTHTASGQHSFDSPKRFSDLSLSYPVPVGVTTETENFAFDASQVRLLRLESIRAYVASGMPSGPGIRPIGSITFPKSYKTMELSVRLQETVPMYAEGGGRSRFIGNTVTNFETTASSVAEITDPLPRWRLVPKAETVMDPATILSRLKDGSVDPKQTVLLETPSLASDNPYRTGTLAMQEMDPNHLRFETRTDGNGYLVLADTNYPGWRAFVDGKLTPILPANYYFRAVAVPPGSHTVEFRFWPTDFTAALVVSGAGIVALLVLLRWPTRSPVPGRPQSRARLRGSRSKANAART